MPKSMPTLTLSRSLHRGPDGLGLRVNVPFGCGKVTMAGKIPQGVRVHVFGPPREASMPERVYLERLYGRVLAGFGVLFPESGFFDMAALGGRREDPLARGRSAPTLASNQASPLASRDLE